MYYNKYLKYKKKYYMTGGGGRGEDSLNLIPILNECTILNMDIVEQIKTLIGSLEVNFIGSLEVNEDTTLLQEIYTVLFNKTLGQKLGEIINKKLIELNTNSSNYEEFKKQYTTDLVKDTYQPIIMGLIKDIKKTHTQDLIIQDVKKESTIKELYYKLSVIEFVFSRKSISITSDSIIVPDDNTCYFCIRYTELQNEQKFSRGMFVYWKGLSYPIISKESNIAALTKKTDTENKEYFQRFTDLSVNLDTYFIDPYESIQKNVYQITRTEFVKFITTLSKDELIKQETRTELAQSYTSPSMPVMDQVTVAAFLDEAAGLIINSNIMGFLFNSKNLKILNKLQKVIDLFKKFHAEYSYNSIKNSEGKNLKNKDGDRFFIVYNYKKPISSV